MRIIGFILIFSLGVANLTIKRRLPPKHVSGGLFNFGVFKSAAFSVYCASTLVAYLGLYTRMLRGLLFLTTKNSYIVLSTDIYRGQRNFGRYSLIFRLLPPLDRQCKLHFWPADGRCDRR